MPRAGLPATSGASAKRGSDRGSGAVVAGVVGGILLAYACVGFGVYAALSVIL